MRSEQVTQSKHCNEEWASGIGTAAKKEWASKTEWACNKEWTSRIGSAVKREWASRIGSVVKEEWRSRIGSVVKKEWARNTKWACKKEWATRTARKNEQVTQNEHVNEQVELEQQVRKNKQWQEMNKCLKRGQPLFLVTGGVHNHPLQRDGHLHPVVHRRHPAAAGRPHCQDTDHAWLPLHPALWDRDEVGSLLIHLHSNHSLLISIVTFLLGASFVVVWLHVVVNLNSFCCYCQKKEKNVE